MIESLDRIAIKHTSSFGSKTAVLGQLTANGFNIPKGFSLSQTIYIQFLEYNGIKFLPEEYLGKNDQIQTEILEGTFPPDTNRKLKQFYDRLYPTTNSLAVRSSALCEDSQEHSFAGIFESHIQIEDFDSMTNAIKLCYASLFSDKALSYANRNRIPFLRWHMPILVQEFIAGRPSGVILTVDTVEMDPDINHDYQLG